MRKTRKISQILFSFRFFCLSILLSLGFLFFFLFFWFLYFFSVFDLTLRIVFYQFFIISFKSLNLLFCSANQKRLVTSILTIGEIASIEMVIKHFWTIISTTYIRTNIFIFVIITGFHQVRPPALFKYLSVRVTFVKNLILTLLLISRWKLVLFLCPCLGISLFFL